MLGLWALGRARAWRRRRTGRKLLIPANDQSDLHQHSGTHHSIFMAYWSVGWSGTVEYSGGGLCTGVAVVTGGGSQDCDEGSGMTVGWGGTSVVLGTSGQGVIVVVVVGGASKVEVGQGLLLDAGTSFTGGTSLGFGVVTSETGVSVPNESSQRPRAAQRNPDKSSQNKGCSPLGTGWSRLDSRPAG